MILFDKKSKIMAAGDHIVGFGSSILDPESYVHIEDIIRRLFILYKKILFDVDLTLFFVVVAI